jgi:hypothetical protein
MSVTRGENFHRVHVVALTLNPAVSGVSRGMPTDGLGAGPWAKGTAEGALLSLFGARWKSAAHSCFRVGQQWGVISLSRDSFLALVWSSGAPNDSAIERAQAVSKPLADATFGHAFCSI